MPNDQTTVVVERYLDALAGDAPADHVICDLIASAVGRLRLLSSALLYHGYPRLTRPPLNLESDELLGAVVARLLKALREVRPGSARDFFALATQHMRWELNDLARRLDNQPNILQLHEDAVTAPESSESGLSPVAQRILAAIDTLPEAEREVLSLVRFHGLAYDEAAELLGVSTKTVQRRLKGALISLVEQLPDLRPDGGNTGAG
jgi:RNA polymerase sigma-70 factor (ECF subfamily)